MRVGAVPTAGQTLHAAHMVTQGHVVRQDHVARRVTPSSHLARQIFPHFNLPSGYCKIRVQSLCAQHSSSVFHADFC